jgi:Na+-driven multidrug efflux pump
MGAVISSFAVNISRQGLLYIPALLLLRHFLAIYGLAWTQPVADALALALAIAMHTVIFHRMSEKTE